MPPLVEHSIVKRLAVKYGKTPAQILLRYGLESNVVVIPSSSQPSRIEENVDILDFNLAHEDKLLLLNLDQHGKYRKFDFLFWKG